MSRPHLSAMGVIYEALGFAVTHFGTVLRVAWLPLVLLLVLQAVAVNLGFAQETTGIATSLRLEPGYTFKLIQGLLLMNPGYIALMAIAVVLQASIAVPLIHYAAAGVRPHHGTMHLSFGLRHLKYVLACAVSFASVVFLARLAILYGTQWMRGSVVPALQVEQSVFEEDSLHSIEIEPVFGSLNAFLAHIDAYFFSIGINLSAVDTVILVPVLIIAAYLTVRLFPLPFMAAARDPGAGYTTLGGTLHATGGWNLFPMIAIILLYILIHMVFMVFLWAGMVIYSFAANGSETMLAGLEGFLPEAPTGPVIRGAISILYFGIITAAAAFLAGLNAGIGGAIVHRAAKD